MRILVIGGTGTIGKAVVSALKDRHEVVVVGHTNGDHQVDISSLDSIRDLYRKLGHFDALACATGLANFGKLEQMSDAAYRLGLDNKLMGQVNLVLLGLDHIRDKGSFTLISGVLCEDPVVAGSSASLVNGAINSFVKAAAIEMPRGLRINAICPGLVEESVPIYGPFFPGFDPVSASKVGLAFCKSIEGAQTGKIYRVLW